MACFHMSIHESVKVMIQSCRVYRNIGKAGEVLEAAECADTSIQNCVSTKKKDNAVIVAKNLALSNAKEGIHNFSE